MHFFELPIGKFLSKRANQFPDLEALVGPKRRITYKEYEQISNQIAHFLLDKGIQKGDRIAVFPETNVIFPLFYLGAAKIGAITVPINWRWSNDLISHVLNEIEPKLVLYDSSFTELVHSLPLSQNFHLIQTSLDYDLEPTLAKEIATYPSTEPTIKVIGEDPVCIVYTSGTTGKPKGVVLTHSNMYSAGVNNLFAGPIDLGNRILIPFMLSHISAMCTLSYQSMAGYTTVYLPQMTPQILLETIENEKINFTFMVPPLLRLLLPIIYEKNYTLSSLKEISTGGSHIPRSIIEDYEKLGFQVAIIYGCTESAGALTYWTPKMGYEYYHSVGKPFLHEIAILDRETRKPLPVGEIGELAVRGPTVFKEYWRDPEATKNAFHDGWLLTGDAAYMDEHGFVYLVDRYKDVIYFGGTGAIFPSRVENVIRQLEQVADVAVIGVEHDTWGEIPCAFIVKKPETELTREQVFAHVHSQLPKHNLADVVFVQELPRNALGKVDKPQLRKWYTPQSSNL